MLRDLVVDMAGAPSAFPAVSQVDATQPIATWNRPPFSQVHGPTLLPDSHYAYFTMWTDDRILIVDTTTHDMVSVVSHGSQSAQLHGVVFNEQGTIGLSAGYFYDKGLSVFRADKHTGQLEFVRSITLGTNKKYAAYSHTVYWIDNRYAVVGTMQFGPTSLTPRKSKIIGPSIWMVDALTGDSRQIIGTTDHVNGAGVLRSASYVVVAGQKLFIAEEDSLDQSFGDDGFISVFDISDIMRPVFLKRFKPGAELPADYSVAHAISVTLDEQYVLVESYHSGYIIKIDVATLQVATVTGPEDGLVMPHGGVIAGRMH